MCFPKSQRLQSAVFQCNATLIAVAKAFVYPHNCRPSDLRTTVAAAAEAAAQDYCVNLL